MNLDIYLFSLKNMDRIEISVKKQLHTELANAIDDSFYKNFIGRGVDDPTQRVCKRILEELISAERRSNNAEKLPFLYYAELNMVERIGIIRDQIGTGYITNNHNAIECSKEIVSRYNSYEIFEFIVPVSFEDWALEGFLELLKDVARSENLDKKYYSIVPKRVLFENFDLVKK